VNSALLCDLYVQMVFLAKNLQTQSHQETTKNTKKDQNNYYLTLWVRPGGGSLRVRRRANPPLGVIFVLSNYSAASLRQSLCAMRFAISI